MPKDLPGFYFDAEKNRYFPIKGPIPGSSRNSSSASTSSSSTKAPSSVSNANLVKRTCRGIGFKPAKLLQVRELHGNVITSSRRRCNFQEEYLKVKASQPGVWKYHGTGRNGDIALELIHVNVQMPHGLVGTDILLGSSMNGSFSIFEVGKGGPPIDYGVKCMPDCVWPFNTEREEGLIEAPGYLWRPSVGSINKNISCMKLAGKHSNSDSAPPMQHLIFTTLGSEASGGSIYTLSLGEPLDCNPSAPTLLRRLCEVASFNCTVWTADCNFDGSQAAVGTNFGAAMVNLETGVPSWVLRCKSDVLSLQFDHSGKNLLCGLRNGAIVTVDARQKSEGFSTRLGRHQISYPSHGTSKPSSRTARGFTKQWFELKGDIFHSQIIFMPSSITCLASLQFYDKYFLASSMDGSIRLYDHRLIQRGPVQIYEGNVNSHTRIQLGIDPYERIVMSGGEDCNLRLWSIKSGELLYENKFMDSVPSVVCWSKEQLDENNHKDRIYDLDPAWLGSEEGLFYLHWL